MSETQWQTLHRLVSCLESKRIELHPENALETFLVTSIIPDETSKTVIKLSDGATVRYLALFETWFKAKWDEYTAANLVCKINPDVSFLETGCRWQYKYDTINKKGHQFFPPEYGDITKSGAPMLPLDTVGSKVWFTNYIVKQTAGARGNSTFHDTTKTIDPDKNWGVHVPDGLRVFWPLRLDRDEAKSKAIFDKAERQIYLMFLTEKHQARPWISMDTTAAQNSNPNQKQLIFYTQRRDSRAPSLKQDDQLRTDSIKGYFEQPTFKRVLAMIEGDYPDLALFILIHGKAIQNLLQCTDEDLENCSLMLLEYSPKVGFRPHIDGVSSFGDEFGPIFTINMYNSPKKLYDMFPVLNDLGMRPIRVNSRPGEIIMTQGTARALYSHSIPTGIPSDRATIAFKFGHVHTRLPITQTHSFMLDADIPSIDIKLFYGRGENQVKGERRDGLSKDQYQANLRAVVSFQEFKKRDFLLYGPNPRELTREEEAEVKQQEKLNPGRYQPRPPVPHPIGVWQPKAHTASIEEPNIPEEADVTEGGGYSRPESAGTKRGRGGGVAAGPSAARDYTATIEVGEFLGLGSSHRVTLGFANLKEGDPFLAAASKRV